MRMLRISTTTRSSISVNARRLPRRAASRVFIGLISTSAYGSKLSSRMLGSFVRRSGASRSGLSPENPGQVENGHIERQQDEEHDGANDHGQQRLEHASKAADRVLHVAGIEVGELLQHQI